jgi:hypothetical protein
MGPGSTGRLINWSHGSWRGIEARSGGEYSAILRGTRSEGWIKKKKKHLLFTGPSGKEIG